MRNDGLVLRIVLLSMAGVLMVVGFLLTIFRVVQEPWGLAMMALGGAAFAMIGVPSRRSSREPARPGRNR